jgi:hypothetical protein
MNPQLANQILCALGQRDPPAAFVTEVAAVIRPAPKSDEIEEALADLDRLGRVLVAAHAAPDIHLESTDLRVIARVPDDGAETEARDAAEDFWASWLRTFLANHRCE